MGPREQILAAAADLFIENGFAATTTREIAERVGMRQASLYYHFVAKEDIFAALLGESLSSTLDVARRLVRYPAGELPPATALFFLAAADAGELRASPRNVGVLWLLPEARLERFEDFWTLREELQRLYGQLGISAASTSVRKATTSDELGALLIYIPELIIHRRRTSDAHLPTSRLVAETCLRACGLDQFEIERARIAAEAVAITP